MLTGLSWSDRVLIMKDKWIFLVVRKDARFAEPGYLDDVDTLWQDNALANQRCDELNDNPDGEVWFVITRVISHK